MARPYGPNSRLIERFLDRLAHMQLADFGDVVRRWRAALAAGPAWYAAEDAVGDAIAQTRRDDAMWVLQDHIYAVFRDTPWYASAASGPTPAPPEVASQYLATSAAVALLVADVLAAEHLNALYAPFAAALAVSLAVSRAARARARRGDAR